ncbi:CsbD family protein [Streptomyces sp. NPDC101166]|uniref:CsbD family protein n=1 Tax=Actinomycetes TaxID=1760 RepID=UPI0037FD05FA
MSATDKAKNKSEELRGKAKEKFGAATNDPEREQEGKIDQVKSDLKSAGEKVKDAFKH